MVYLVAFLVYKSLSWLEGADIIGRRVYRIERSIATNYRTTTLDDENEDEFNKRMVSEGVTTYDVVYVNGKKIITAYKEYSNSYYLVQYLIKLGTYTI